MEPRLAIGQCRKGTKFGRIQWTVLSHIQGLLSHFSHEVPTFLTVYIATQSPHTAIMSNTIALYVTNDPVSCISDDFSQVPAVQFHV